MLYTVRLNPRAYNPITRRDDASRRWEVVQMANKDSEAAIWHCAEVRVDGVPVQNLFNDVVSAPETRPKELKFYGVVFRAADNAIEITTRTAGYEVH